MAKCKACGTEIVWLVTKKGKQMPVRADSLTQEDREMLDRKFVVAYRSGVHVPHRPDCQSADLFRK